ncbi:unnamed protein product [Schistosoma margrebowiei]|uniref:Uncharacterized protein n=1 Tax=Schistosoma margrebowiei TaxID=48269 RepID=A0AA84ZQX3_9TREM|nr:unnamed protein product [Schistosoma margrebowiei]
MIALYSHRPVYLLLGRSLNTASTLIQPHITDKHRGVIESCCTIEVTTDRLSYASLCLDPENKNSVILSNWNSLSLNLPSGKEFRPYMCSSMFKATTQRLVHDICSSGKLTSSQFALVYVSSKLSSASLVHAGFMGYLIGYLCTESIKQEFLPPSYLPVFTMNHSYRKHLLSSWRSKFVSRNPECIIRGIEDLFTTLPKLSFTDSNSIATYTNIFLNADGNLSNYSVRIPNENQNISYNQLSLANVLVDGYGFLVHGIMVINEKAYNCSNIIKDNILCSNYLGASTDVILRPIAPLSTSSFTKIHNLDIRNVHQAVIMGYLLAFLSSNINNTPTGQLCISTNCPSIETLVKWTNQSTNRWTTYLSHQMFKNQPNITFSLLPVKSNHLTNISAPIKTIHNNNNDSSEIIQMRVESSQLFSIYKCFNSKNHEHINTVQFLLARCLLLSVKLQLHTVDLHPTILADGSIIRHRTKRWAFYEIHKCGRIKGYSCLEHRHCYERYLRHDMVCFEVYPCLSSCIFIAQLHDAEKLNEQIKKLLLDGIPVNNHNDPINYVREQTAKLLKELNLTLPLHNQPKVSVKIL